MSSAVGGKGVVNLAELARAIVAEHEHADVADVNDHRLILAVNEVPFPWHRHPDTDELFVVLEGELRIELEDGTHVDLGPLDAWVVPAGTTHRTLPRGRCVNVVFERAGAETRWAEIPE